MGTGAPTAYLTTTGRKTGTVRINPVLAIDVPAGVGLISSNWGQNFRPGWHYNLLAEPRCSPTDGGPIGTPNSATPESTGGA